MENIKEHPSMFLPECTSSSLRAQTYSCVRSLDSCVCRLALTCVSLFFSLYACMFHLVYACRILSTEDLSYVCMTLGRFPSLGILAHFSSFFHLFTILTSSLFIFALNCMSYVTFLPIVHPISHSHHSFLLIMV